MLNKSERYSTGNWTQLRRGGRGLYWRESSKRRVNAYIPKYIPTAYYIMFLWIPGRDGTRSKVSGNFLVNALHAFHRFNICYTSKITATRSSFSKHGGEVTEVLLENGEYCCMVEFSTPPPIRVTMTKIRVDGTVQNVLKGRRGIKSSSTDNQGADAVMHIFARSPKKSERQCSREIGIEKIRVDRILRS